MGARLNKDSLHSGFYGYKVFSFVGRERGFTLVELLIAMAVASIVAMSGFALFSQSNWSYQVQENVGEAQQNARVAMDRIVRDVRTAGFGLPDSPEITLGGETFKIPITVEDNVNETGTMPDTDKITILGIGYEAGVLVGGNNENRKTNDYICYSKTTTTEKILNSDGTINDTRKHVNIDGVFFATLKQAKAPETCTGGKKLFLDSPSKLKGDFKDGTVYIIQAVEYSIATNLTGCSAANPCLASKDYSGLRGAGRQLLAENIEDIQFAYGLDVKNGKIYDEATPYTTADFEDSPPAGSNIRAVRVTLSARTRHKDPKGATFKRPAIENHPESGSDNYRRRVLTKVVKLRN